MDKKQLKHKSIYFQYHSDFEKKLMRIKERGAFGYEAAFLRSLLVEWVTNNKDINALDMEFVDDGIRMGMSLRVTEELYHKIKLYRDQRFLTYKQMMYMALNAEYKRIFKT